MMPMLPQSVLEDIVRERLGRNAGPRRDRRAIHDPDGILGMDDAPPQDPLYSALRHLATTGWIADVRRWLQARAAGREQARPTPIASIPDAETDQSIAA